MAKPGRPRIDIVRSPKPTYLTKPAPDPNSHYRYVTEKRVEEWKSKGYEVCNLKGEVGSTHKSREMILMKTPKDNHVANRRRHAEWTRYTAGEIAKKERENKVEEMRDHNYTIKDGKVVAED